MRLGELSGINRMIRSCQDKTFDPCVREEAPEMLKIKEEGGKSQQAVGLLLRIAARIRSAENRNKHEGFADTYFPR